MTKLTVSPLRRLRILSATDPNKNKFSSFISWTPSSYDNSSPASAFSKAGVPPEICVNKLNVLSFEVNIKHLILTAGEMLVKNK